MDQAIKIGNTIDKSSSENLKDLITTIFKVGYETHMEQNTIVEALNMVGRVTEVKNVTITNSVFGDKTVNMEPVSDKELF